MQDFYLACKLIDKKFIYKKLEIIKIIKDHI